MSDKPKAIPVSSKHVEKGIEKYRGKIDPDLHRIVRSAGLDYVPYLFEDGRVLLVFPNNLGGLLYKGKEHLFASLDLS